MNDCVVAFPKIKKHPYKIIAFDWDGTAVENRNADARAITEVLEQLMKYGVYIVVITGTNFDNVNRQFASLVNGPHKKNLFICTNRGSEVYGFDENSEPVVLFKRVATEEENTLLDRAAEAVKEHIESRSNVTIDIVYNRMNRRKIDLIPEWENPLKSQIGELLTATEDRLHNGGFAGGIKEAFDLSTRYAHDLGLLDARLTSDVKHIEVGLTDKSDSINWVIDELSRKKNIPFTDTLVLGDEFGPIAGFEGSDFRMYLPAAPGITYVSVGKEPNGVPPGVVHTGGGPACFLQLMKEQAELNKKLCVTDDPTFLIVEDGYDPLREREVESIFTVGNGYLGTRGSLEEQDLGSEPATLLAGVYARPAPGEIEELSIIADWVFTRIYVDGQELTMDERTILSHKRILDMGKGVMHREWRHRGEKGRITSIRFSRFASLAEPHAMALRIRVVPENYRGEIRVETGIELCRKAGLAAEPIEKRSLDGDRGVIVVAKTELTDIQIAEAQLSVVRGGMLKPDYRTFINECGASEQWRWQADEGQEIEIDKFVGIYTTRDTGNPAQKASDEVNAYAGRGFDDMLLAHVEAWAKRWEDTAIKIGGNRDAQLWANFAGYHLIIAGNGFDERVSISARTLTGTIYKGHIFWDADMFMIPFFIYTHPATARAMLMYRYHTIDAARQEAKDMGAKGAMFAWESTSTGEEMTPESVIAPNGEVILILSGKLEQHINCAIAYGVWQYWIATRDEDFIVNAGSEILIETARFWVSRVEEHDGIYRILNIEGPDEYHEIVNDNTYTNMMAVWNIERAVDAINYLKSHHPEKWLALKEKIALDENELIEWADVSEHMYIDMNHGNLIEQFDGFFKLKDIDVYKFEPRTAPLDSILGREETAASQLVKQADVVMLLYLLENKFSEDVIKENFEYYERRTGHGSSLSPSMYGLVAARLGRMDMAMRYFRQAAQIDLANNMGSAAGGVHAAALGGLWQQLIMGFTGMRAEEDGFYIDPKLPEEWDRMKFAFIWRNNHIDFDVERNKQITITIGHANEVRVGIYGRQLQTLRPGATYRSEWDGTTWRDIDGKGQEGVA
ncbi:MAG: hypothetical protein AUK32_07585 [Candidatus Aquicultor secundus]|nr:glycosyl hydrolase family 65 protein [Candidatus Aquicultor secundus]OIO85300.1 MAG: hypothetical protein AUK32_07585 [Candidatus Aquicultor secundus]